MDNSKFKNLPEDVAKRLKQCQDNFADWTDGELEALGVSNFMDLIGKKIGYFPERVYALYYDHQKNDILGEWDATESFFGEILAVKFIVSTDGICDGFNCKNDAELVNELNDMDPTTFPSGALWPHLITTFGTIYPEGKFGSWSLDAGENYESGKIIIW